MKTKKYDLMDNPGYAAAKAKLQDLEAQKKTTEQEMEGAILIPVGTENNRAATDAERILAGKPLDEHAPQRRRDEIQRHIKALATAIELQKRSVESARQDAERALTAEITKEYRTIVETMRTALTAAATACQAEERFRDDLLERGFRLGSLNPVPFNHLGCLTYESDRAATWLREAKQYGHIS